MGWSDIENDPDFKAMSPQDQLKTRRMYLSKVVAKDPEYKKLDNAGKQEVIGHFLGIQKPEPSLGDRVLQGMDQVGDVAQGFLSGPEKSIAGQAAEAVAKPLANAIESGVNHIADAAGREPIFNIKKPVPKVGYEPRTVAGQVAQGLGSTVMDIPLYEATAGTVGGLVKGTSTAAKIGRAALEGASAVIPGYDRAALTQLNEQGHVSLPDAFKAGGIEGMVGLGVGAGTAAIKPLVKALLAGRVAAADVHAPEMSPQKLVKEAAQDSATDQMKNAGNAQVPKASGKEAFRRIAQGEDPVQAIQELHANTLASNQHNEAIAYAPVDERIAQKIRNETGTDVSGFEHLVNSSAIRHVHAKHGLESTELPRGLEPVTAEDFSKIPDIIAKGEIETKDALGNPLRADDGRQLIRYKYQQNGTIFYVEEIREGKGKLAAKTLYKTKAQKNVESPPGDGVPTAETVTPLDTSKTDPEQLSTENIPQSETSINGQAGFVNFGRTPLDPSTPEGQVELNLSIGKKTPWHQKLEEWVSKLRPNVLDDLAPLQDAEKAMGGDGSIYQQARLTRGTAGKVQQILEGGAVDYNTLQPVSKGLKQIFDDVRQVGGQRGLDEFRAYATARRVVSEANGMGRTTGIDLQDAQDTVRKLHGKYGQAFSDLQAFNDGILQYAVKAGTLSPETYKVIKAQNPDYVPFMRVMDLEQQGFGGGGRKFANLQNGVKKMRGSDRQIIDPFESMVKNTHDIIAAADKYAVSQAIVDLAKKNPGTALIQPYKFNPQNGIPKDALKVMINGKAKFFKADPELYQALLGLDREQVPMVVKFFGAPASILRAGATLSPEFGGSNVFRDTFTAGMQSRYGFVPVFDTVRGALHVLKKDDLYKQWRLAGGDNALLTTIDRGDVQKELAGILDHPAKRAAMNVLNPIEALRTLSELSEKATRLGEFARGVAKEGATKEGMQKAALSSREATLDFARMGNQMQNWNKLTAFLNARVQGWDKMVRQLSDPKTAPAAWAKGLAGITVPSMALTAVNMKDERWQHIPDWEKVAFWHILVPNGPVLRIPKPPGYGAIFATPFERITEFVGNKDPKALEKWAAGLKQELPVNFSETPVGTMPTGLLPTAAGPMVEAWANKSLFTGQPIIPPQLEKVDPKYQYTDRTSETSKAVGAAINASPAMLDNLVHGYGGGLGGHGLEILDALSAKARAAKDKKPATGIEQMPVVKAFVSTYERGSDQQLSDFYEASKASEKAYNTLQMLTKDHPEQAADYYRSNEQAVNTYLITKQYSDALSALRKGVEAAKDDALMTPQQKREAIKNLKAQMSQVSAQALVTVGQMRQQANR